MRITAVHTAVVEANYDWTYMRVDADEDGLYGLGESFTAPGLTAIIRDLAPLLVGEDAEIIQRDSMLRIAGKDGAIDLLGRLQPASPVVLGGRLHQRRRRWGNGATGRRLHHLRRHPLIADRPVGFLVHGP